MIASVRGTVEAVRLDSAVLEVGGVGLRVQATPATLAGLRHGAEARMATSLVVREDSLTLYGFADDDEREVFEVLQTVSGVGPRLALAVLAVHGPDALRAAVAAQDVNALTKVPGIGKKGAQRILLEIGDKLGPVRSGAPAAPAVQDSRPEVVDALVQLGWPARAAEDAVTAVLAEEDGGSDVAAVLRAALQYLGGRGRG
ncbi:Holliday junction branch migration protein RuvA [Georgenia wutianyii]|uniref:Holliday junction branch migration complex subunit RuvA n=1 Tax=Georgenia wutianyii TaxID=2585135 RepID=A0ABX5VNI1_9MICO|nr:Holliday junction branch migration protein RuvA [Georgenia wutianyii]QDB79371.1 Holliday junction branch migration protein RuvA [Georgenia wutianyii]